MSDWQWIVGGLGLVTLLGVVFVLLTRGARKGLRGVLMFASLIGIGSIPNPGEEVVAIAKDGQRKRGEEDGEPP